MQTTVSLEVAKLVDALGVKGNTEKWLQVHYPSTRTKLVLRPYVGLNDDDYNFYRAYSFSEILDILPQIGEKLGWRVAGVGNRSEWQTQAHFLLDLYLTGGMEAVNEELKTLLANK